MSHLEGAYAFRNSITRLSRSNLVVRKRSPLCVGIGDNEMFIASDLSLCRENKQSLIFPDESFAIIKKDMIELYDFSGKALPLIFKN